MAGPQSASEKNYLLYDGACGVCHAAARLAERLDYAQKFAVRPYQQISAEELQRYRISTAECARRVHVLTARGKIHAGAFAVNYLLWQYFPWKIFIAVIYLVPILLLFEIIGYEIVARNRRRLSQWLGLTACALPPQGASTWEMR